MFINILKGSSSKDSPFKVMLREPQWKTLLNRITVPKKTGLPGELELVNFKIFEMDLIHVNPKYAVMSNYVDAEERVPQKVLIEILREVFKKYKTPEEFVGSLPPKTTQKYVVEKNILDNFKLIDTRLTNEEFAEIMKLLDPRRKDIRKLESKILFADLSENILAQILPLITEVILFHQDCRQNTERIRQSERTVRRKSCQIRKGDCKVDQEPHLVRNTQILRSKSE